jgi:hypothetical protein
MIYQFHLNLELIQINNLIHLHNQLGKFLFKIIININFFQLKKEISNNNNKN